MRLEALSPTRAALTERIAPHWRTPLLHLALCWAAILVLFAPDWAAMAQQWWDISTYNHILLVPAIIAWLVWQRADELVKLTPQAWWPGLVPLAGALFVWLLGDLSGLATASQLGVVTMMQASVLLVLGPRVSVALLFPLFYGVFLVPLGEELVPTLQMVTAAITIWLTEASGIHAVIEGVFIDTPVGLFEVAEACSGVKFLVAMIALGTLIAHVCFRAWGRRIAFMAAAVVIPILANGVRAWGTIFIAQHQGIEFAEGFDHIFYGWVFFGLVMALLIGAGWRFFDRSVDDPMIDGEAIAQAGWLGPVERFGLGAWQALAGFAALTVVALAWSGAARQVEAPLPSAIALPAVAGWSVVPADQAYAWEPRAHGADRRLFGTYQDSQGRRVDVYLALYGAQEDGREAGAFGEGAQPPDTDWRWLESEPPLAGVGGERMQALGAVQRVTFTWYRQNDWTGGSRAQLKLQTMLNKLALRETATFMLILSAEDGRDYDARAAVGDFAASTDPLGQWMDGIAGLD